MGADVAMKMYAQLNVELTLLNEHGQLERHIQNREI